MSRDDRRNEGTEMLTVDAYGGNHGESAQAGCSTYGPWLDDHVDGLLEAGRDAELTAHLTTCEPCRGDVAALRQLLRRVAELPTIVEPRRDLWQEIAPRLAAGTADSHPVVSESVVPESVVPETVVPESVVPESGPAPAVAAPPVPSMIPWWAQAMAACLLIALGYSAALVLPPSGFVARPGDGSASPAVAETSAGERFSGPDLFVEPRALTATSPTATSPSAGFMLAEVELLRAKQALLMAFLQRREDVSPETFELLYRNLEVIDQATRDLMLALRRDPANPRLEVRVLDNYRRELSLLRRLTSRDV